MMRKELREWMNEEQTKLKYPNFGDFTLHALYDFVDWLDMRSPILHSDNYIPKACPVNVHKAWKENLVDFCPGCGERLRKKG